MLIAILDVSAQYQTSVLNATKDAVSMHVQSRGMWSPSSSHSCSPSQPC